MSKKISIWFIGFLPCTRLLCLLTAKADIIKSIAINIPKVNAINIASSVGISSIFISMYGRVCLKKINPSTPQYKAYKPLVLPPKFKGVLLYCQEIVPIVFSCTKEQIYSNIAPTTALTIKIIKALKCSSLYKSIVKTIAPNP